jgi:single-strand DNA-binding protein
MISNHAVLIGRLTRDVEVRKTQSDKSVASFTIAVNKPYNKEHDHPEADFFGCTAWEAKADFIAKYFKKGDKIAVAGRLQTREYEKDGNKQRIVELVVEEVEFVEKRSDSAQKNEQAPAKAAAPKKQPVEEMDDELPF